MDKLKLGVFHEINISGPERHNNVSNALMIDEQHTKTTVAGSIEQKWPHMNSDPNILKVLYEGSLTTTPHLLQLVIIKRCTNLNRNCQLRKLPHFERPPLELSDQPHI